MVSLEKKPEKSHKLIHFEPQFQEMKKLENRNMNWTKGQIKAVF